MRTALAAVPEPVPWPSDPDRVMAPALTVERLRPHFSALGITRLARQTGLDRIGIPCFAAMRPLGLTLSVTQGKGLDDASAMASAIMEAAEYAIVERPECLSRLATAADIIGEGGTVFDARRLLPQSAPLSPDLAIHWVEGQSWPSGARVFLPLDALTLGHDALDLPRVSRSSNGLASGNTNDEALFHAICELIERDATAVWSLLPDPGKQATCFAPEAIDDPALAGMVADIAAAGLELRLFDQTTDLGVPCVMAVIREPSSGTTRRFDVSAGYGCHPVGARAMGRAITEAAQTRITNIAGARDDFLPAEYFEGRDASTSFLDCDSVATALPPSWLPAGTLLPELLAGLADRVGKEAGIVWAKLGGERYGISVLRALSTTLEDREVNTNWRPGKRTLRALAGR